MNVLCLVNISLQRKYDIRSVRNGNGASQTVYGVARNALFKHLAGRAGDGYGKVCSVLAGESAEEQNGRLLTEMAGAEYGEKRLAGVDISV